MDHHQTSGPRLSRQITTWSVICILTTFLMVAFTAFWMARSHNAQAAVTATATARGVIESARSRLATAADGVVRIGGLHAAYDYDDRQWLDSHVGSSLTSTEMIDVLTILSPDGQIQYGWKGRNIPETPADILTPDIIGQITVALDPASPSENREHQVIFAAAGDRVLLLAPRRISPSSNDAELNARDLPILVLGRYLDKPRLAAVGDAFDLHDFEILAGPPSSESALRLDDVRGRPAGYITWTQPAPGFQILLSGHQPLLLGLATFCVAMFCISYRTRMLAMALAQSEQKAIMAAHVDPLTHLTNRAGFNQLMASPNCVDAAARGALAIIYLDVNAFKQVNDSAGHSGGDEMIRALAVRLSDALPGDAVLARVGGDEFAIVLSGAAASKAADVAHAVTIAMQEPFSVAGIEFHLGCAIGFARAGAETRDPLTLIRQADTAMYRAKGSGRKEAVQFRPSMDTGSRDKKQFENRLRAALRNSELDVFYQPIARAADRNIVGLEALVRWHDDEMGNVPPSHMISVAEESGLIREIGDFVLERVCQDYSRWPHLRVSVNVSPVQLRDPDFISNFRYTLARHNVSPGRIEIELTEGVLIADPAAAAKKLQQLRKLGVTIALDDFGTGFSSIGYMRSYPFDRIKIDRSFIQELGGKEGSERLVESLVSVASSMNLPTVAEGVETEEQLRLLNLAHCEFIQGYLLSRPAPASAMEDYLREHAPRPVELAEAEHDSTIVRMRREPRS
ncbi:putative bifunctional diguanylate cyclase/phosphodiesterase [Terrihabitans sp. B22-R8]|uniref:putative bifunctional diguanylate cyclase/phosphodiesterase n=1 Tax=Terrihabitans sp. B22-R8 TaxID=3425128 RepID=UPI00403C7E3D